MFTGYLSRKVSAAHSSIPSGSFHAPWPCASKHSRSILQLAKHLNTSLFSLLALPRARQMRDWSLGEAESPAQGHTARSSRAGTPPPRVLDAGGITACRLRRLQPLSRCRVKCRDPHQLPETQCGVSALKIVCYILHLVD